MSARFSLPGTTTCWMLLMMVMIFLGYGFFCAAAGASDSSAAAAAAAVLEDPSMDGEEAKAVFDVLEAINYEIDWRALFPGDNPCTGGPHGVNCDVDAENVLHVVELNLGWVSDIVNNPPCATNATIHPSILKFKRLRKLFFYQCFVGEPMVIPDEISMLGSSLLHLTFQDNSALVGQIPARLANLSNLERLVLTENKIDGRIPRELGGLKNLKQLVLSHNLIGGKIPASLGDLEHLMILDLSGNGLVGEIPEAFGGLRNVQKVDLSMNALQGSLPSSIGINLGARLRFLDLSFNNFSGGIPQSFSALNGLQNLFLRGNPFLGGSLPGFLGNLSRLEMLALSGSGFAGSIPDSIGELRKLNSLALDGNMLSGSIPVSLGRLQALYHLNLSSNRLSGPLPFSSTFLRRLGRNLVVKNNTGLCHVGLIDEKTEGAVDPNFFGIQRCDDAAASSLGLYPSSSQQHEMDSAARPQRSESGTWVLKILLWLELVQLLLL